MFTSFVLIGQHNSPEIIPLKRVTYPSFEVIGPISGKNAAQMRNLGARYSTGEWIFFCDSDCHFDLKGIQDWIKRNVSFLNDFDIIGGRYRLGSNSVPARVYNLIQRLWLLHGIGSSRPQALRQASHLLGGCLLVRKSCFNFLGGFREEIGFGGEETEFISRAQSAQYKTGISYRLSVRHAQERSLFNLISRAFVQNFNRGFFGIKSTKNQKVLFWSMNYLMKKKLEIQILSGLFYLVSVQAYFFGRILAFSLGLLKPLAMKRVYD